MAERGVRGNRFDLRPTSKKKFVSNAQWIFHNTYHKLYHFFHNTCLLFLTENYEHRVNAFKRTTETFPLFPQYMPSLVDSLKKVRVNAMKKESSGLFVWARPPRIRLVYVFKNWKLLFKNICENTCGWKSTLKCVKYCLKTENGCLKILTKHPLSSHTCKCNSPFPGRYYTVVSSWLSSNFLTTRNEFSTTHARNFLPLFPQ